VRKLQKTKMHTATSQYAILQSQSTVS